MSYPGDCFRRSPTAPSPCEAAFEELKDVPFQDLTHTKIDLHRQLRKGIQEVIFGEGKTFEQISDIVRSMTEKGHRRPCHEGRRGKGQAAASRLFRKAST